MRRLTAAVALAAVVAVLASPAQSNDAGAPAGCAAPSELMSISPALTRVATRIQQHLPLTIVALGSSSTRGVGASAPEMSYPSRLEVELKRRLPEIVVSVVNRGKNGEEAAQMLLRLERDVIALHPDLVIWQLGTNAVLHEDDVTGEEDRIERGIERIKATGSDVVLMDMQYAPRVIARPAYAAMERLLADEAKRGRVGLFRRFDLMRYWHGTAPPAADRMVGPDGLHMTDRGYGCLAADLAEALAANLHADVASVHRGDAKRFVGLNAGALKADGFVARPAP